MKFVWNSCKQILPVYTSGCKTLWWRLKLRSFINNLLSWIWKCSGLANYTGKFCSRKYHVKFTWISRKNFHVRFTSNELIHETHVKFFTWISRESDVKFTWIEISREIHVKFYMWNSCELSLHVKLTWTFHVKLTWIELLLKKMKLKWIQPQSHKFQRIWANLTFFLVLTMCSYFHPISTFLVSKCFWP